MLKLVPHSRAGKLVQVVRIIILSLGKSRISKDGKNGRKPDVCGRRG